MDGLPVGSVLKSRKTEARWKKRFDGRWVGSTTGSVYASAMFHPMVADKTMFELVLPFKKVFVNETEY